MQWHRPFGQKVSRKWAEAETISKPVKSAWCRAENLAENVKRPIKILCLEKYITKIYIIRVFKQQRNFSFIFMIFSVCKANIRIGIQKRLHCMRPTRNPANAWVAPWPAGMRFCILFLMALCYMGIKEQIRRFRIRSYFSEKVMFWKRSCFGK